MHALRPSQPPLQPVEPRRRVALRARAGQNRNSHRAIAAEVGAKLTVNVILAIAAVTTLVKLLPYNLAQQDKLQELKTEVTAVENRVDRLRTDFNRHFDPQQARNIMQEQNAWIEPGRQQVVWLEDAPNADVNLETSPQVRD